MPRLEGAYSTVVMTKHAIVAFRDPHGIRPLSLGRLDDRFVVASESCAFDIIGAELMREVHPGEMVSLTERGLETRQVVKAERRASCVFEHIYFSRPDSRLEGKVLQQARGQDGRDPLARGAGRGRPGDRRARTPATRPPPASPAPPACPATTA